MTNKEKEVKRLIEYYECKQQRYEQRHKELDRLGRLADKQILSRVSASEEVYGQVVNDLKRIMEV